MSEYINNQTKRQEALKQVIRQLHDGRTVDEVKAQFAELLEDVGATEIAQLEQALISEGLPETEVKRLCDVHVAVFRESLEAEAKPESLPGHPVHTFLAENAAAAKVLDELGAALEALKASPGLATLGQARQALAKMREYEKHYLRKENILFPYLEKHDFRGPSAVMWAIHDDVRADWKALAALLERGPAGGPAALKDEVNRLYLSMSTAVREMFFKEQNILHPAALEKLSLEEWAAVRAQEAEIGYAYVQPGDQWPPAELAERARTVQRPVSEVQYDDHAGQPIPAAPAGTAAVSTSSAAALSVTLGLETGHLTHWELNAILKSLPVDITYVGADDRVRFFSQGPERVFPRSPAIIGRLVQQCHPPKSVHKVQMILEDFRAGRRDVAEFWIQSQGKFIHIVYVPIRDEQGAYQGALEITQDATHLRGLQGEKRLLDD